MTDRLTELRKAFWHLRTGGASQLRKWNEKRLAQGPLSDRRKSGPVDSSGLNSESLRRAWGDYAQRKGRSHSAAETYGYRNFFAQGWLLSIGNARQPKQIPARWRKFTFGTFSFRHDPDLEVTHLVSPDQEREVLLLGQATDSAKELRTSESVAPELLSKLAGPAGWDSFDEAVTWLGGRFVVVGRRKDALRVHVDAMATRSCYWAKQNEQIVLGSHSALVAEAVGDTSSAGCSWVLSHPDYDNPAGKWLPGMIGPHDAVKLVIANCVLTVDQGTVTHRRFFSTPPEKLTVSEATERYLAEVRFQMDAALDQVPKSFLGLTAGSDSRAMISATLDLLQENDVTAYTYHFFMRDADHSRDDLLGANRLAYLSGLPHRILDVSARHTDADSAFRTLYSRTFPTWARFPTLARTYYEDLGSSDALILGIGGEVGTVFYREREYDEITPAVLAAKYTQSAFKNDQGLIETMAEYMDYTQLDAQHSAGYDILDLFYWEHRMSSWAAYGYAEADFGPRVVLPLNSRRIFHAMLSLPYKNRLRKSVYRQLAAKSGITD